MTDTTLPTTVEIVEVGPRDGLQTEPDVLSVALKCEFIERAIDAGLRRLEVASFVNPKRVPQMAGAEELIARLPKRDDVTYIGLLFNERGLERAIDCGIDEVGMVVVASDTFNRKNQGVGTDESIDNWLAIAERAHAAGLRANVMISAAFGCPYEGEVAVERVLDIATRVMAGKPVELAFADTIGVAVPPRVRTLISAVRAAVGEIPLRSGERVLIGDEDAIRIEQSAGFWDFLPDGNGGSTAVYETYVDLGGSLPGWLVEPMMAGMVGETFEGVMAEALGR